MSILPPGCAPPGTPAFVALNNQRRSPLLKLPAELRNTIFAYAFQEHCIIVRRNAGGKISFHVQPQDFPRTLRYPLSDLLARAKTCLQIYQETAGLIMSLNAFQLSHIDCINPFVQRLYPWKLGEVKSVILGMPWTSLIKIDILCSDFKRLVNLKQVVVDRKGLQTSKWGREQFVLTLMTCIGEYLDVEFV